MPPSSSWPSAGGRQDDRRPAAQAVRPELVAGEAADRERPRPGGRVRCHRPRPSGPAKNRVWIREGVSRSRGGEGEGERGSQEPRLAARRSRARAASAPNARHPRREADRLAPHPLTPSPPTDLLYADDAVVVVEQAGRADHDAARRGGRRVRRAGQAVPAEDARRPAARPARRAGPAGDRRPPHRPRHERARRLRPHPGRGRTPDAAVPQAHRRPALPGAGPRHAAGGADRVGVRPRPRRRPARQRADRTPRTASGRSRTSRCWSSSASSRWSSAGWRRAARIRSAFTWARPARRCAASACTTGR